jgi:hypothetical protein
MVLFDRFGAIAILSIHEKVKPVLVRVPILVRAISVRAGSLEVAKGAGRATK